MSCTHASCSRSNLQTAPPVTVPAPVLPSPFGWLPLLVQWQHRWRLHDELRDLDDRTLRDVGLTREQLGLR
jgi:uncharacterized protein YjiS (DUF1127 family)